MVKLADRVRVLTPTVGTTGTLSLGDPVLGYQTFAQAGVQNGDSVRYVIEDGTNWEIGTGVYNSSGPSMSRSVIESSNSNALLVLTGNASVFLSVGKTDLQEAVGMDQGVATTDSPTFVGVTTTSLTLSGTPVTATAAELNKLAGVTATAEELNILDGATADLNKLAGVTATAEELNILDGVTATTTEINLLDGATSLGISAPATTTDGGVALFDGTNGSALKDGGTQDAVINGLTVGRGGIGVTTGVALGEGAYGVTTTDPGLLPSQSQIVAIGFEALAKGAAAGAQVAVGYRAMYENEVSGLYNTCVGHEAGYSISSGRNNTLIGRAAGKAGSPFTVTTADDRVVLGDNNVTNAYIKVSWTVTSDERDKTDFAAMSHGLDVVDAIDTFTFKFDNRSSYYVYDDDGNIIETPTPDGTHKSERTFVGFKAQQVRDVLDAAGFPSDVVVDTEDPENLKMKETALIPLLINAIKELKARVEALEAP